MFRDYRRNGFIYATFIFFFLFNSIPDESTHVNDFLFCSFLCLLLDDSTPGRVGFRKRGDDTSTFLSSRATVCTESLAVRTCIPQTVCTRDVTVWDFTVRYGDGVSTV